MKLLVVTANQNQTKNIVSIIKNTHSYFTYTFICPDSLYFQQTVDVISEVEHYVKVVKLKTSNKKPFYYLSLKEKLSVMKEVSSQVSNDVGKFDAVIHSGESALLSSVLKYQPKDVRVVAILDGYLKSPTSSDLLKYSIIRILGHIGKFLKVPEYLPSLIGSSVTHSYFVMSESVKKCLLKRGYQGKIIVSKLPRHSELSAAFNNSLGEDSKLKLLYATTAFEWHGDAFKGKLEKSNIKELYNLIKAMDVKFKVRVHPRDSYNSILSLVNGNSSVLSKNSLEEDLAWADIVISAGSSISFEAAICNKEVVIYKPDDYGITDDFPVVRDLNPQKVHSATELCNFIKYFDKNVESKNGALVYQDEFSYSLFINEVSNKSS